MVTKKLFTKKESGFALLMTIIVVGVVLSVGVVILDLSIKQVKLSTNAKDSEIAFHAANAGAECGRYWRKAEVANMLLGQDMIDVSCFGVDIPDVESEPIPPGASNSPTPVSYGDGTVYEYTYEFTWTDDSRCTQIATLFSVADSIGVGVTTTRISELLPGFPQGDYDEAYCEPGAQCTLMSVRGYNQRCATVGKHGTVQREVLLQF